MAKYRGVLMVPTVIEFESEGSETHVTEQARRICRGMGKATSACTPDFEYEPTLMEIKRTEGEAPPAEMDIVFTPQLA
jgi:hypothetical protein